MRFCKNATPNGRTAKRRLMEKGEITMSPILFQQHSAAQGKKIIQATLNSEKSLNALTLEMIRELAPKLSRMGKR